MGVALIVSVIGLSALHVARLHLKTAVADKDRYRARLLAMSAVEHAVAEFNTNPSWQSDYAFDTEYPATPPTIGGGTFAWKLVDLGGNQRRLDGIGRMGPAECVFSVDLGSGSNNYLACGLLCGDNITVGQLSTVEQVTIQGAPLCTNADLTNNLGIITADVEAQTINNSGTITGTQTAPAAIRSLPDSNTVFDFYVSRGTLLSASNIQNTLLSPFTNPFGPTNPDGIYVIDASAGGLPGSVSFKRSRIVGTVVVLNASKVTIDEEMNWEPARPNFPALMVQGNIECRLTNNGLLESDIGFNLNPAQTPFQGETDTALDDTYPSAVAGIVYATGNLLLDGKNDVFTTVFDGLVIVNGTCNVIKQAHLLVQYDSTHANDPPPGFGSNQSNKISRGTWRQTPSN